MQYSRVADDGQVLFIVKFGEDGYIKEYTGWDERVGSLVECTCVGGRIIPKKLSASKRRGQFFQ